MPPTLDKNYLLTNYCFSLVFESYMSLYDLEDTLPLASVIIVRIGDHIQLNLNNLNTRKITLHNQS